MRRSVSYDACNNSSDHLLLLLGPGEVEPSPQGGRLCRHASAPKPDPRAPEVAWVPRRAHVADLPGGGERVQNLQVVLIVAAVNLEIILGLFFAP